MHIFGRRADREAELRRHPNLDEGLAALPAASKPLDAATRNMLRAVATALLDGTQACRIDAVGLDATAAVAVGLLAREPGLSVGDLAHRLERSHSATVRLVERLEEHGLVDRARSRTDNRRATLALTRRGTDAADAAAASADQLVDQLLGDLTSGERVLFKRIMDKIVGQLAAGPALGARTCRNCDPRECGAEGCPRERLL